jgi:hypothetical protein
MHNKISFGDKSLQTRTEVLHVTDILCVQYQELMISFPDDEEKKRVPKRWTSVPVAWEDLYHF